MALKLQKFKVYFYLKKISENLRNLIISPIKLIKLLLEKYMVIYGQSKFKVLLKYFQSNENVQQTCLSRFFTEYFSFNSIDLLIP